MLHEVTGLLKGFAIGSYMDSSLMALTQRVAMRQVQNYSFVIVSVAKEKEVWVRIEDWKSKCGHYLPCNFLTVKWALSV